MVSEKASSEGFLGPTFVDLGCGDFRVGRQLLPLCSGYIGVDIVKPLICRNQEKYGNATTRFMHLDIVIRPAGITTALWKPATRLSDEIPPLNRTPLPATDPFQIWSHQRNGEPGVNEP